jgi:ribosomal protein L7/L12
MLKKEEIMTALIKQEITAFDLDEIKASYACFRDGVNALKPYGITVTTDLPVHNPKTTIENRIKEGKIIRIDKIALIKEYRSITGADLKQAKDAVEATWTFDHAGNVMLNG